MMLSDVTFTIEQCERIYFFLFFLFNFLSIYLSKSDTWKGLIRYNCCIVNIQSQKIVIIPTRKITRQCKNLLSKVELIVSFHSILRFFFFFFKISNRYSKASFSKIFTTRSTVSHNETSYLKAYSSFDLTIDIYIYI